MLITDQSFKERIVLPYWESWNIWSSWNNNGLCCPHLCVTVNLWWQTAIWFFAAEHEGFSSYLWSELSRGYVPDENEAAYNVKKERVYAFLRIPKECEQVFGSMKFHCLAEDNLFYSTFFEKKTILIVPVFLASQKLMLFIQNYAGVIFVPMFVPFNIKNISPFCC